MAAHQCRLDFPVTHVAPTRQTGTNALIALAAGYWVWLVWTCAGEWSGSEDYSYGWFVPLLALYFLWKRHETAGLAGFAAPTAGRWLAWCVLASSAFLVLPLEMVRLTPIHWRPVLWGVGLLALANTLAVAWLAGGRGAVGVVAFPAFFMLLGIPWPTFAENRISFPLMQLVAEWTVDILRLAGLPATAAGTTITLPNCSVGVEEACSGLRSLQTALMVGVAAGELAKLNLRWRAGLLAVALVMALAGNQARVLLLAMAGVWGGTTAVDRFHDAAGYLVLVVLLGGVAAATLAASRWQPASVAAPQSVDRGSPPESSGFRPAGWCVLLPAAGLASILAAHAWFWVRGSLADPPSSALLQPTAGEGLVVDANVPQSILGVLQPDEYSYIREHTGGRDPRVIGYHFYWKPRTGNANQLYHRPDRCMPGAGWRIDGEVTRESFRVGGREFVFNIFPLRGPTGQVLMLWGAFLNGEAVEIAFNSDVYLGTANLRHFLRTGTRAHSYEVAAFIMPFRDGRRPSRAEVEAFANRVFSPAGTGSNAGTSAM